MLNYKFVIGQETGAEPSRESVFLKVGSLIGEKRQFCNKWHEICYISYWRNNFCGKIEIYILRYVMCKFSEIFSPVTNRRL